MAGILEPEISPAQLGLLSASFAALKAMGTPSRMPVSGAQALGEAGLAGIGTYAQALGSLRQLAQTQAMIDMEKERTKLLQVQAEAAARKEKLAADLVEGIRRRIGGSSPLAPSVPGAPGMSPTTSQLMFGSPDFATKEVPAPVAPQPFSLSPEDVFGLKAGGVGDFTELMKFLATPQERKAGSFYQSPFGGPREFVPDVQKGLGFGPQGIFALPGAETLAQLAGQQAGAQKAAELPFLPPTRIDTANGPRLMTAPQAIEFATGAPPPAVRPLGTAPASYSEQDRFTNDINARLRAGPLGGALQGDAEKAFEGKYGGELGGMASEVLKAADAARNRLNVIQQARLGLESIKAAGGRTGKQAPMVQAATEWAQALKIDPQALGLPKEAGGYQLMDAALNRMAMGMIGPGGIPANNFSEADRAFAVATVARKVDTEAGVEAKLYVSEKLEQRAVEAERSWETARAKGQSFEDWRASWNSYIRRNSVFSPEEKRNVLLKMSGGRESRGVILQPPSPSGWSITPVNP